MSSEYRYKFFFFFSFCFLAFFLVFLPVLWKSVGFSRTEIAFASMMGTVATIFSAPLFLSLAHSKLRASVMLLPLLVVGFLFFTPYLWSSVVLVLIVCWFGCSFAGKGIYALVEAQAVRDGSEGKFSFEDLRVWGSIGFLVANIVIGLSIDRFGVDSLALLGLILLFLNYLGAFICRPLLSDNLVEQVERQESFFSSKHLPAIVSLFAVNFLLWASHTPLYLFLSVHLQELGWTGSMISVAWNLGVVFEIALFAIFPSIEKRIPLVTILRVAIVFTVIRWAIMSFESSMGMILFAQALHLFSFGACYLASIKLVFRILPNEMRDRGQGFLTAAGIGLGSFGGRLLATYFAEQVSIEQMFLASGVLALLAYPISFLIPNSKTDSETLPELVSEKGSEVGRLL